MADLNGRYFNESSRQIGVDETNDFVFGELHNAFKQLFDTLGSVVKAARTAVTDVNGDDAKKEFMVLPDTHVLALRSAQTGSGTWRVTGVDTSSGLLGLAPGGSIVIALGTIESARLALPNL